MEKCKIFAIKFLSIVLIFGTILIGCTTTQYGVEVNNIANIREIYIRNAGTTSWGSNMAENLQNIDISRFSNSVDIRVVDTNGIVYSKHNVPFNEAVFIETSRESHMGMGTTIAMFIVTIPFLIFAIANTPIEGGSQ